MLLPRGLRALSCPLSQPSICGASHSEAGQFHVSPHYLGPDPLAPVLALVAPGHDEFISEKYHDQIASILAQWSSSLRQNPRKLEAFAGALAPNFLGTSLRPVASRLVRSTPPVEVRQRTFAAEAALAPDVFLQELRAALRDFESILTAEFQVTDVRLAPPSSNNSQRLQTRVRYELAGSGRNFYREHRLGQWDLEWEASPPPEFRIRSWQLAQETCSRASAPVFSDVTARAFAANPCFASQLLRGADYWRTVLDGASGIDIYGHNGVAVGDIDNDGCDDIYVCQPAGLPNRLFRNRQDGTFQDVTEQAGVGILENTACAIFADFDNDGRQDLIVVRATGPLLFLNLGGGRFRQQPDAFHFANSPQGTFTGAAVADYDRDGWLDIYFCLYAYYQGADQYRYPCPYYDAENGPPNFLMRNGRDNTFCDVTAQAGLNRNNTRYSFCCGWTDATGNGWPDLCVVNDFGRKNLYRNNGDGTFTDVAAEAGVEDTGAGMGVCWFDYDNDGRQDLYVADMWTAAGERISAQDVFQSRAPSQVRALYRKHAMGNSLFRNRGHHAFQDATASSGVALGRWSWSCDAWDFDHDGFLDLYIANGMVSGSDSRDLNSFFWRQVVGKSPQQARPTHDYEQGWNALNELIRSDGTWSGFERNVFYVNKGDGTFANASAAVGLDFLEDGRAFALADFDHDGRLELLVKNRNAPQVRLLRNVMQNLPPSIAFRLRGTRSNRDAIGAVITLHTELGEQTRQLQAGSGFLSQHTKELFFGLGNAKGPLQATIRWPSGLVQQLRDLPSNHRVWVQEGREALRTEPFSSSAAPSPNTSIAPPSDLLPSTIETWLLVPVPAPEFSLPDQGGRLWTLAGLRGKSVLLHFWSTQSASCAEVEDFERAYAGSLSQGLQLLTLNVGSEPTTAQKGFSFPLLRSSEDVAGVYNVLYRYLFDRHRDLALPTSFLIDPGGRIVKLYQGALDIGRVQQDFRHIPANSAERSAKALPFPGVASDRDFQRNYLSFGSVYFQRGYYDQAQVFFELALRDNPSSAEALYGLGSVFLKQNKRAEARRSFQQAVTLQSSYPDTLPNSWNNLGLIAAEEGRILEATQNFQQALRLNPESLIALENLGNAYRQRRLWDHAQSAFARALAIDSESPGANYGLAMVYAARDDAARAYQYLQKALQFRPNYPEALNNLGVLYMRTRRRDQAVATLEKCMRVAPAFDQCYLNLARIYSLEANPGAARAILLQLLKQHPGHVQARKALAELPQQ